MHPRVQMFLRERDRARSRGDWGVDRSLTADLRRLGVADDATLQLPAGRPREVVAVEEGEPREPERRPGGRPKLPRCEHGVVADRCEACNPDLLAS